MSTDQTTTNDNDNPSNKKKPTYHIRAPIEDGIEIEQIIESKMKQTNISITLHELLAASPMARKSIDKLVSRRKIINDEMNFSILKTDTIISEPTYLSRPTAKVCGKVYGFTSDMVVNPGSEVNLLSSKVYDRISNITIDTEAKINIVNVNGTKQPTRGICYDIPIKIGRVIVIAHFLVVDNVPHKVLLGMPWLESAGWEVKRDEKNIAWVYVYDKQGTAKFRATPTNNKKTYCESMKNDPYVNRVSIDPDDKLIGSLFIKKLNLPDPSCENEVLATKYKTVENKICPAAGLIPLGKQLTHTTIKPIDNNEK